MDDQERIAALEQALRDAAEQRDAAQRRAVQQAEKTAVWQTRAEERAQRIDRVVAERDQLKSFPGWVRARIGRTMNPPPARPRPAAGPSDVEAAEPRRRIAFPTIRVAALTEDPLVGIILAETNLVDLNNDPKALEAADLVVVEGGALARAGEPVRLRFEEWMGSLARAPVIVIDDDEPASWRAGDVRYTRDWVEDRFPGSLPLFPTFDPLRFNPRRAFDPAEFVTQTGIAPPGEADVPGRGFDPGEPWMLAAAATGHGFTGIVDTDDPARCGVAARRTAFRDSAPWVVAAGLLDRAGIGHEPPLPTLSGILVSMRPELVPGAARRFATQTHPRKELIIGCHRFAASEVADALSALEQLLPIRVLEFEDTETLGQCLNRAIERSSGSLIAKIDDDDFYGPHYVEDAVQANRYAQAPLIGKGATFTYLESVGETVLRRPEISDRFYDGSPSGASLVFERHLWERAPFPHRTLGEDLAFIDGVKLLGIKPYATTPYEFVYHRGITGNTWEAVDEVFLEGSIPAWQGHRPEMAVIDA